MTAASEAPSGILGTVPTVTVGMPVYNGAKLLRRALDSLLAQSFQDFEIVISDNASSDSTPAICEEYARRDARIRYVRATTNQGASWNFNRVVALARGELFVWAAHDDWWHVNFLQRCRDVLAERPDAVACYTHYQPIDEQGGGHGIVRGPEGRCEGATVRERWNFLLRHTLIHVSIYGLLRTAAVRRTRGVLTCQAADLIFMTEMILQGDVAVVDEILHYKFMRADGQYRSRRQMLELLGARKTRPSLFPRRELLGEQLRGLQHAGLPPAETGTLQRDAWKHYLTAKSWLYDGVEAAQDVLGVERVRRVARLLRRRPQPGPPMHPEDQRS